MTSFLGLKFVCLCAFYILTSYELSKYLQLSLNVLACNLDDLVVEEFCLNLPSLFLYVMEQKIFLYLIYLV